MGTAFENVDMRYRIAEVEQDSKIWDALLEVAPSMSDTIVRHLTLEIDCAGSNHILVAIYRMSNR